MMYVWCMHLLSSGRESDLRRINEKERFACTLGWCCVCNICKIKVSVRLCPEVAKHLHLFAIKLWCVAEHHLTLSMLDQGECTVLTIVRISLWSNFKDYIMNNPHSWSNVQSFIYDHSYARHVKGINKTWIWNMANHSNHVFKTALQKSSFHN